MHFCDDIYLFFFHFSYLRVICASSRCRTLILGNRAAAVGNTRKDRARSHVFFLIPRIFLCHYFNVKRNSSKWKIVDRAVLIDEFSYVQRVYNDCAIAVSRRANIELYLYVQ